MPGPPADVDAETLFLKLLERPRPSEVVDFPRADAEGKPVGRVRLQVLTSTERNQALRIALEWCKKDQRLTTDDLGIGVVQEGIYGNVVAREILALACVSERDHRQPDENGPPLYAREFASGAQVDQVLTPDELGVLFSQYTIVQNKYGPCRGYEIRTEAELSEWVHRIVTGGSALPFALLNSSQSVELLAMLSARVFILSHILESQYERLPTTLGSRLMTWEIGTGYWSVLPEDCTDATGESSTASAPLDTREESSLASDEPVSLEDAVAVVRKFQQG